MRTLRFFTLVLLLPAGLLFSAACSGQKNVPLVQKGVMDLSHFDINADGPLALKGDWEFYWNRLLKPADFQSATPPVPQYFSVPGNWNQFTLPGAKENLPPHGFATFRVRLKGVPVDEVIKGLNVIAIATAYKLYLNGRPVMASGVVGPDEKTARPAVYSKIYEFKPPTPEVEILLQISNYEDRNGGFWNDIEFGNASDLRKNQLSLTIFELGLCGALFIMALYHFALFALRQKDLSTLFLGLFSLLISIRTLVTGQWIIMNYLDDSLWVWIFKVNYITFYAAVPIFFAFVYYVYPTDVPRKIMGALLIIGGATSLFVLLAPAWIYTQTVQMYQAFTGVIILYVFYLLGLMLVRRRPDLILMIIGIAVLSFCGVNDILAGNLIFLTGLENLTSFGLFLFFFSQSVLLSVRFSRAFTRTEELSERLKVTSQANSRFVPQEILKILGKHDITELRLGEQVQRDMTVIFTDIRSFTTLSESMTPEENFNFLNSYLKRIGPIIRENHGYIDKYIGDAIMAIFPEKPEDALRTAVSMHHELNRYNVERVQSGYPAIETGIGIHYGSLMLGTIGESERMQGTVISDTVNIASRIESLNKKYHSPVLTTETTLHQLKNPAEFDVRPLGLVKVKGKVAQVKLIEILNAYDDETRKKRLSTLDNFDIGVMALMVGKFQKAEEYFKLVIQTDPEDNAALYYLDLIAKHAAA